MNQAGQGFDGLWSGEQHDAYEAARYGASESCRPAGGREGRVRIEGRGHGRCDFYGRRYDLVEADATSAASRTLGVL